MSIIPAGKTKLLERKNEIVNRINECVVSKKEIEAQTNELIDFARLMYPKLIQSKNEINDLFIELNRVEKEIELIEKK